MFDLIESFEVEYAPTSIKKWRSKRTGLEMVYINQPSPIVNGYFTVATESPDDAGCPHTLEHLIFLGSEKYPYKGLLDSLGNRLFSTTNAWTSQDQTVYTLSTAGWDGFKTLLPVYLDHLINPTLTDEGCLTEVYHIDGKGEEKGVVFSEMQGTENQSWSISDNAIKKLLYGKDSGYSSETGGYMGALRKLTNEQIREFHKSHYRPDNLSVVVSGSIEESEFIQIMEEFDSSLISLPEIPNKRPFVDSPHDEPLTESIVQFVDFPERDESMGEIVVGWIGPKFDDNLSYVAIDVMGDYFTDLPISIFNKHLVEVENPSATDADYGTSDYLRTGVSFYFSGVPTEKLQEVGEVIHTILQDQTDVANFDLKLVRQAIQQQKLKIISDAEKSPSFFRNSVIVDFIYSDKDQKNLEPWCKDLNLFDELTSWTAQDWCNFIKTQFVDNKSVTVLCKPSNKLNKSIKAEDKQRKLDIIEKYGEEGLKELEQRLENAQKKNDLPIPDSLLTQFEKPDPSKISFINTKSYKSGTNDLKVGYEQDTISELLAKDEISNNPLFFHFDHFKSEFVTIFLSISTVNIDKKLLRYLSVLEEIFSMSIQLPDNTYISYEELNSLLNDDLIEFSLDNGFENNFLETLTIKVKCEYSKYAKAVDWILKVMKYNVLEENRMKIIIEKIINSLPEKKRDDEYMMYSKQYRTLFNENSTRKAQDSIHNEEFYHEMLEEIKQGHFTNIAEEITEFKRQLFQINNFRLFVIGNVEKLGKPISSWSPFIDQFVSDSKELAEIHSSHEYRSSVGLECSQKGYMVVVPAADSTHLVSSTKIPTDYLDEDIFKIALASEYLSAIEGPFWRGVRGTGLAYGVSIARSLESGYLNYTIYRGSDATQAWSVSKKIVDDLATGVTNFEPISIENSVSALINALTEYEANVIDASVTKISDLIFRQRGSNYKQLLIGKLKQVTKDDLVYIMKKYFQPLFDARSSVLFTSVSPSKTLDMKTFLTNQGYNVEIEEVNVENDDEDDEDSMDEEETSLESDDE